MVLSVEKRLDLVYFGIELEPLLVHGLRDTVCGNACTLKPASDGIYSLL